jgi:hypothetical protein
MANKDDPLVTVDEQEPPLKAIHVSMTRRTRKNHTQGAALCNGSSSSSNQSSRNELELAGCQGDLGYYEQTILKS